MKRSSPQCIYSIWLTSSQWNMTKTQMIVRTSIAQSFRWMQSRSWWRIHMTLQFTWNRICLSRKIQWPSKTRKQAVSRNSWYLSRNCCAFHTAADILLQELAEYSSCNIFIDGHQQATQSSRFSYLYKYLHLVVKDTVWSGLSDIAKDQ